MKDCITRDYSLPSLSCRSSPLCATCNVGSVVLTFLPIPSEILQFALVLSRQIRLFSVKFHRKVAHVLAIFRESIYRYFLLNSGLHSQFSKWPASSAGSMLSCKVNGQGSHPTWAIFCYNSLIVFCESVSVSRVRVRH